MIKTIVALFFGTPYNLLYAFIAVVVLDYITGVCAAVHTRTLSSKVGAKGISKKVRGIENNTPYIFYALCNIFDYGNNI